MWMGKGAQAAIQDVALKDSGPGCAPVQGRDVQGNSQRIYFPCSIGEEKSQGKKP